MRNISCYHWRQYCKTSHFQKNLRHWMWTNKTTRHVGLDEVMDKSAIVSVSHKYTFNTCPHFCSSPFFEKFRLTGATDHSKPRAIHACNPWPFGLFDVTVLSGAVRPVHILEFNVQWKHRTLDSCIFANSCSYGVLYSSCRVLSVGNWGFKTGTNDPGQNKILMKAGENNKIK